jgi:hypothetical protein
MTQNEQLVELVVAEALYIKQHATGEEISRLDIQHLDPNNIYSCIYGQMTGSCYSDRACSLIEACCVSVFTSYGNAEPLDKNKKVRKTKDFSTRAYFSPIEHFILKDENFENGNNAALVAFLRGESDTLTLQTDF